MSLTEVKDRPCPSIPSVHATETDRKAVWFWNVESKSSVRSGLQDSKSHRPVGVSDPGPPSNAKDPPAPEVTEPPTPPTPEPPVPKSPPEPKPPPLPKSPPAPANPASGPPPSIVAASTTGPVLASATTVLPPEPLAPASATPVGPPAV